MVEVEVIIHNFKDLENKDLGLLQPGYKYKVLEKRAKYLSDKKIVKIISKENKKNKEGE
jgi:hypothetical protein|nr:MAG TPA: hypothetical protein [Caudoviricetes sp.]